MEILKNNKLLRLTKNKITMEERNIKISLERAREWYNKGGELKELALSVFSEKEITESALPNTWEEFCEMYPIKDDEWYIGTNSNIIRMFQGKRYTLHCCNILPSQQAAESHLAYMQLHQLRDCYRQGWVPDWEDDNQKKWCVYLDINMLRVSSIYSSKFLSFQSREIAEKFLNNFQGLIETAGDLI